jgi:ribonuclease HI
MTARTEIHADGTFNDQTGVDGWAAVVARCTAGRQDSTSIYEMELRTVVEAVKMAEGPPTVISDYEWLVKNAQQGKTQPTCQPLWEELFACAAGKDIEYAWRKRGQSLGSRLAHQLARDAARGQLRS